MTEKQHHLWIREVPGGFQAACSCGEYVSAAYPQEGRAGRSGRSHTNNMLGVTGPLRRPR